MHESSTPNPMRRRVARWLAEHAAPPAAALLIRGLRRTVRLRVHGRETLEQFAREGRRYVHVFWHAHLLLMVYSYVGPRLAFMISRHRDGALIARTVERFGYAPVFGSTTAGGALALRGLLREARRGSDIGFTPDGPRGPARRVQLGCVAAARQLRVPVVPVALGANRAWLLRSWDRFVIPKPGADVLLAYGAPQEVAVNEDLGEAARRLEAALSELEAFAAEHAADRGVGRPL